MSFKICKTYEIENAHILSKHPDDCKFPHGHSRRIDIVLQSDKLDQNDMVCDFYLLDEIVNNIIQKYDHAICVNTDDPNFRQLKKMYGAKVIEFDKTNPTTEVMAKAIFNELKQSLKNQSSKADSKYPLSNEVSLIKVRIYETSDSWAEYTE
jgi:6-pyruvoyltetrahydropterin/6-carboxytetrahydropterin synthase